MDLSRQGRLAFRHPAERGGGRRQGPGRCSSKRLGLDPGGRGNWPDLLANILFSDSKSGSFLLPVKAEVRRKEALCAGDRVEVTFEIGL